MSTPLLMGTNVISLILGGYKMTNKLLQDGTVTQHSFKHGSINKGGIQGHGHLEANEGNALFCQHTFQRNISSPPVFNNRCGKGLWCFNNKAVPSM